MRVLLIGDRPRSRAACQALASALSRAGAEVFLDPPLDPETLSTSDLLSHLDAVGLFIAAERVPPFLDNLRRASALRGQPPATVFSGPTTPLVGDALKADLLPRLGADLLCLQGPRQQEELADLLRTTGGPSPPAVQLGMWTLERRPAPRPAPQQRGSTKRMVFLEQRELPPAPGARQKLLEVLERLCDSSPGWEVIVQGDPLAGPPEPEPSPTDSPASPDEASADLATLLQQRPSRPNLRLADPEGWRSTLEGGGVCASISSPLIWEALALNLPALLIGDYGIRTEMDGPLWFGSGLMGRLTTCSSLDELRDLPRPNAGWLHEMGWDLPTDATALMYGLRNLPPRDGHDPGRP